LQIRIVIVKGIAENSIRYIIKLQRK
jgi:hypothetical protein